MSTFTIGKKRPNERAIRQIFSAFDRNKDGYLESYDIGAILTKLGEQPTPADLVLAVQECTPNPDGKISLQSFRKWFDKISSKYHGEIYNRLLVGDKIGQTRRSTYTLPSGTFVYGKPSGFDSEGVAELTSSWDVFNQSKLGGYGDIDYVPMNINASDEGCVVASEYRAHHLSHMIYKKKTEVKPPSIKPTIPPPAYDWRFGVKTISSLPAGYVVETQWEHAPGPETDYPNIPDPTKHNVPFPKSTRASRSLLNCTKELLDTRERDNARQYWKMGKFGDVGPKVDDHWDKPGPFVRYAESQRVEVDPYPY